MKNESAYKVLGLNEGASLEEIKSAYRRLAMKHHPDRGGDADEFKKVQAAYDYLNAIGDHVELRKRPQPSASFNTADFQEVFDLMKQYLRTAVLEIPEVSWYDAINGTAAVKKGVPPGGTYLIGDKICRVKKINLKPGLTFKNQYLSSDDLFVGDIIGGVVLTEEQMTAGCWISIDDPFESQKLKVRVPAGSKFGQTLKIRGKGYWNWKRGPISRADLYIKLEQQ